MLRGRRRPGLAADTGGVTAVELALIFPVFLTMIFAVLEIGIEFLTQVNLDHATATAARQIQIGSTANAASFTASVCNATSSMLVGSCSSTLKVYVTSGSSFAALTPATISASGTFSPTTFAPGNAGSDVLVEVAYVRPYLFRMLSTVVGSTSNTLLSVNAVQNEPY